MSQRDHLSIIIYDYDLDLNFDCGLQSTVKLALSERLVPSGNITSSLDHPRKRRPGRSRDKR